MLWGRMAAGNFSGYAVFHARDITTPKAFGLSMVAATPATNTIFTKSLEASNASMTQSVPALSLAQNLTKVLQTKQTNVDGCSTWCGKAGAVACSSAGKESHMESMVFERSDHVIVACHGRRPPTMAEWEAYLKLSLDSGLPLQTLRYLIFTHGGGPDSKQRQRLELAMRIHGVTSTQSVVVTDSWIARQIVRVMSWFNPICRVFAGHELDAALTALDIPPDRRPAVLQMASRLHDRLGLPMVNAEDRMASG
jgi:hypothetical protein